MAMNSDLIDVARRIADMHAKAAGFRQMAARETGASAAFRQELEQRASALDCDMCAACDELRRLAKQPYGRT